MVINSKKLNILGAVLVGILLQGCTGGTSSEGLGFSLGGTWKGALKRNNVVFTNFTMSISQLTTGAPGVFGSFPISGVINTNHRCIGNASMTGFVGSTNINITADTPFGVLELAGTTDNSNMSGSWLHRGERIDTVDFLETVPTTEPVQTTTTVVNDDGDVEQVTTIEDVVTGGEPTVVTENSITDCNLGGSWVAFR